MDGGYAGLAAIPILALDEVDSTNAEAARRAQAGEVGPIWITAARQTLGRGRRGRSWEMGEGDLAATLLMTTERSPAEAAQISFIAALAVCELARGFLLPARVRVKWPNDVLVDDDKLAGVLVESGRVAGGPLWLAVGIGVNLVSAPDIPERPAISLAEAGGAVISPQAALERLSASFCGWLNLWDQQGFAAIAEAWTVRAYGLGRPCVARLSDETLAGVAEGLDVDGALRLRLDDGRVRRVTAGDVFFGVN